LVVKALLIGGIARCPIGLILVSAAACGGAFVVRSSNLPPCFKFFERPGWIETWVPANERDNLLQLGGTQLGCDFIRRTLMEKQNSRDNISGYAFGCSPAFFLRMKFEAETIHITGPKQR
jgi:hypothetical protein